MATATLKPTAKAARAFVPREHGATAMLLTPFFSAAILLRHFYWPEIAVLVAMLCAYAIKDPLVIVARQRWVWKQPHPETEPGKRSIAMSVILMAACGVALINTANWLAYVPLAAGAGAFTVLAVMINVRNRQRSEWFQVASAVALTSTSIAAALSAQAGVPTWCWMLWCLSALQATAGIFIVHARLDARVAARKGVSGDSGSRRAAFGCQIALVIAAAVFAYFGRLWIAAALLLAAAGYLMDLRRQKNPASLQMSLKRVGQQALALSIAYSLMVVIGLW